MAALRPVSRRVLIQRLKRIGFKGPFQGADHQFMERGTRLVKVPNPHRGDIGVPLLKRVLDQGGITRKEWERRDG